MRERAIPGLWGALMSAMRVGPVLCLAVITSSFAAARRTIPDNNLAYPVLINIGPDSGSGFFLNTTEWTHLVTAKHVLLEADGTPKAPSFDVVAHGGDPNDTGKLSLKVDIQAFLASGLLVADPVHDVVALRLGRRVKAETPTGSGIAWLAGVARQNTLTSYVVVVPQHAVKRFQDVLVANTAVVFGYPRSLGLKSVPQLDYERPLLRSGIIAGKNVTQQTIIIDCPVYGGNSGGPVLEIDEESLGHFKYPVIGVVSQFVPATEVWKNETHHYQYGTLSNSGYAIVVAIDPVLGLLEKLWVPETPAGLFQ